MFKGFFKLNVDIIKYDGSNEGYIKQELNIDFYDKRYFKNIPSYFIIPKNNKKDWFILDQQQFDEKIQIY